MRSFEEAMAAGAAFEPLAVSVFGTGHVGLVNAAGLAELGHLVVCVAADGDEAARLAAGELPFHEPGLSEWVTRHRSSGRLCFVDATEPALSHGRVLVIAVDPPGAHDGSADLRPVIAVANQIGDHLWRDALVVVKSTVPVGTAERVREVVTAALARRGEGQLRVVVASNPEFLREGHAVEDFLRPERIVVGAEDAQALALLQRLYAPLHLQPHQWQAMGVRSAEFTKYASNVMLAARVSVMNDFALLAERLGVDIDEVRYGMAADRRIGEHFLSPGCGYGGSCLPKDLRALRHAAASEGLILPMLDATELVNERQKALLPRRLIQALGGSVAGRRVALWGLAFKPGTDDLHDAPSEAVIHTLVDAGAEVVAYDPLALPAARLQHADLGRLRFAADPFGAVSGADALVIATDWPEFRLIDWSKVRRCMAGRWVFDGRNVCAPGHLAALGFFYRGVGRVVDDQVAEEVVLE